MMLRPDSYDNLISPRIPHQLLNPSLPTMEPALLPILHLHRKALKVAKPIIDQPLNLPCMPRLVLVWRRVDRRPSSTTNRDRAARSTIWRRLDQYRVAAHATDAARHVGDVALHHGVPAVGGRHEAQAPLEDGEGVVLGGQEGRGRGDRDGDSEGADHGAPVGDGGWSAACDGLHLWRQLAIQIRSDKRRIRSNRERRLNLFDGT